MATQDLHDTSPTKMSDGAAKKPEPSKDEKRAQARAALAKDPVTLENIDSKFGFADHADSMDKRTNEGDARARAILESAKARAKSILNGAEPAGMTPEDLLLDAKEQIAALNPQAIEAPVAVTDAEAQRRATAIAGQPVPPVPAPVFGGAAQPARTSTPPASSSSKSQR